MSGISPGSTYSPKIARAGRRDAFHAPCILCRLSVESKYHIDPGDRVRIVNDCEAVHAYEEDTWDGFADPFVPKIGRADLFWVFLKPSCAKHFTHDFEFVPTPDEEDETERPVNLDDGFDSACRKCDS